MRLALKLTYPHQRILPAEPDVDGIRVVDVCRAIRFCGFIIIKGAFGEDNIVPDVDRYRIHRDGDRITLKPHPQCQVKSHSNRYNDIKAAKPQKKCDKTIVIILESPHKDEYLCNVGHPIAPAQGSTGSNIQGWLDRVLLSCPALRGELMGLSAGTGIRVLLSNPVQFQASLASIIKSGSLCKKTRDDVREKVRDAVWNALWDEERIKTCFKNRLRTYSPDYIINTCTKSGSKKQNVSSFLKCKFPNCEIYEVNHPSFWHIKTNRELSSLS